MQKRWTRDLCFLWVRSWNKPESRKLTVQEKTPTTIRELSTQDTTVYWWVIIKHIFLQRNTKHRVCSESHWSPLTPSIGYDLKTTAEFAGWEEEAEVLLYSLAEAEDCSDGGQMPRCHLFLCCMLLIHIPCRTILGSCWHQLAGDPTGSPKAGDTAGWRHWCAGEERHPASKLTW